MNNVYPTPGYPYPDVRGPISHMENKQSYEEARYKWRTGLSDTLVRAMAADYRMGKHTEDNLDAYHEYLIRFEQVDETARTKKPTQAKRKRRKARV